MNAETLKAANWTTIAEIENSGEISCIDGRHSNCVVGAPGGNIGEMILMLSVAERLGGYHFSPDQIEQLLANYASTFGRFYMHTDTHAVKALLQSLSAEESLREWVAGYGNDIHGFFHAMLELNKSQSDQALKYLLMPEHVGCGHLKLLIQEYQKYQVRSQLVLDTIAGFFRLMWLGNKRMHWEMLEGDHCEQEVVVIDADQELRDESAIPYACHSDKEQRFVTHSAARRFFHKRDAAFINKFVSYSSLPTINIDIFVEEIERLADLQLNNTLRALAKDLPVVRVVIG